MKKTIVALMALVGVAFGAEYTVTNEWSAQFGSAYTDGYQTNLTTPGTFWDAGDVKTDAGAQTHANKRIHMAGGAYGDFGADFEYMLNLTFTGDTFTAGHFSEIKADTTGSWVCLGVDTDGVLTLSGTGISGAAATGAITLGTAYDITFTKIGNDVTLKAGDASITATIGDVSGVINNIALGGNTGGGDRVPVLVSEIKWGAVTVTPDTPAVPEPTTATLSLLALAGLAARRRRK